MVLWGIAGCGKTTLAATAPGKKLWLLFDPDGEKSLRGRDDVLVLDLSTQPASVVDKFKGTENPLGLEKFLVDNAIDTVVVDSVTNFQQLAVLHAVSYTKGATIERPSLQGYGARNALTLQMVKNLLRLTKRLNKHIIFICHEADPEKNEEGIVIHITLMLGGQLCEAVPLDVSEVWNVSDVASKRRIAIRPCRARKPMKTRMFHTSGEPEFEWRFNADTWVGDTIDKWYKMWIEAGGKKIPVPK